MTTTATNSADEPEDDERASESSAGNEVESPKGDLNRIRLDLDKVRLGVRVPWPYGGFLRIGRVNSVAFAAREQELVRKKKKPTPADVRHARNVALSELVLLGWEDLEDDGVPLPPYTQKKALELLEDPALEQLQVFVWAVGSDDDRFRKVVETVQGN